MKIRTFFRHIREGIKNLGRNIWMTFASILSVVVTLLILGIFILLALNVNHLADTLEHQVEILAYMETSTGPVEQSVVERRLSAIEEISEFTFVHKDEGFDQLLESLGEQGRYFADLRDENNPLPDMYVIKTYDPQQTPEVARQVEQIEYIYLVRYGEGVVERLFSILNLIRNIGMVFIIGLAFTAMLLISNTIKITIFARRREIEIMRLVGAKNNFIRWPFFIEGLLMGVIGALIPTTMLYFGYQQLVGNMGQVMSFNFAGLLPIDPLIYQLAYLLVGIGAFIGIWGSVMSVRKFLKK
jgi:cell division transport system permease protein